MEISYRKCAPKASPRPVLIFVNNLNQPLHARNSLKIRYFEGGLSKKNRKLTLYFPANPVPFNGQDYEKQKCLKLVTSRSLGYKTSSEKFLY